MRIITTFIAFLLCLQINLLRAKTTDSTLQNLDRLIENRETWLNRKLEKIQELKNDENNVNVSKNPELAFDIYDKLYGEYKSFVYDSAFKYVLKINNIALQIGDRDKIGQAQIKMGFTLLSSGLFKESLDILGTIQPSGLQLETRINFYTVIARTYYDLADYVNDEYFASKYQKKGNQYMDSALDLMNQNTAAYWAANGLRRMKANDYEGALDAFNFLLSRYKISDHEYAIATSSLGYIYMLLDRDEEAIDMLIKAAIADLKASTRETVALRNLAVHLFNRGDIRRAYRYIKIALNDATFYNARHRKIEVGAVLPIIEGERLSTVEKQKGQLVRYAYIVTILSVMVIIFFLIIYVQLKKLKVIRLILQETNNNLQTMNNNLREVNAIKEEYIGYFFNANSEYIEKMETFQKNVYRKIVSHQYEDLLAILKNNNLKKERENLFHNFDEIFLKLFPLFVEEFNTFFKKEDQVILKNNELLSPELRIFALIRLGITDNEKIARFLNYSVNTIYTYKTKVKNKVQGNREIFEHKIIGKKIQ